MTRQRRDVCLIDSPDKDRNLSPSARKAVPPSLPPSRFPTFSKAEAEKANKKGEHPPPLRPRSHLHSAKRGRVGGLVVVVVGG